MGWLRDLMLSAAPPYRSFGTLARASLSHPAWPAATQPQARSLATIYSKLDRDLDLPWLGDRTDVQRVLSELLGCSVADIQANLVAGSTTADDGVRRVRLDDVRFARALDLLSEPLPPGIPDAALQPERWGRVWWRAKAGSGRTLAGRWLAARGLARFVREPTERELADALRTEAAVFVELTEACPVPARDRVCVAAPFDPPPDAGWRVIESPSADEYLLPLARWVEARLESDGDFDAERFARWLGTRLLGHPDVDTFGTVLGLCGLFDELGTRNVENKDLPDAARRYVELRLAEWRQSESGDTSGIERRASDVMLGMLMRVLTDDDRAWHVPRSFDEWIDLVPPEHHHGADVAWLRLSLTEVDRTIRASDIERAARRLPPGAHRIVRALRGARLLAAHADPDVLVLSPRWLGVVLAEQAERRLLDHSPFEWGEALLRPHAASGVATALRERVQRGDTRLVEGLLELGDDDNPAYVAALENAFVAAGLAVLAGTELSPELAGELCDEQLRLSIEQAATVRLPRVLEAHEHDAWLVAGVALLELAGRDRCFGYDERALLRFHRSAPVALAAKLAALVDRLERASSLPRAHRLAQPSLLIEAAQRGDLSYDQVRALDDPERDLASLFEIASERGLSIEALARAIWLAWDRARHPPLPPLLATPAMRPLLAALPPELVGKLLARARDDGVRLPLDAFGREHWSAFVQASAGLDLGDLEPELWTAIPREQGIGALSLAFLPSRRALELLWQRFSGPVREAYVAALTSTDHERAVVLLAAAPDAISAQLIEELRRHTALDRLADPALHALERVVHERVIRRAPGFREAYALLSDLEQLLASSRA